MTRNACIAQNYSALIALGGKSVHVSALLDDGSTASLIDKNLVGKLNLPKTRSNVSIKDIAGSTSLLYSNYKVVIQLLIKNERVQLNNVIVNKLSTILPKKVISRGLADLCLSKTRIRINPSIENPQTLLGQDNYR